jgi:DNA-binding CsgD family transcriptional regulator
MTQVFVFSDKDTFQVLTYSQRPEEIVRTINRGDWQSILGFEPDPAHPWEAKRIGKMVIVYPPVPPEDYPQLDLSPKDYQILQAYCSGMSTDEVAYSLRISGRTVRNRTTIMRLKMNSRTLYELLAKATALGIVSPDLDSIPD